MPRKTFIRLDPKTGKITKTQTPLAAPKDAPEKVKKADTWEIIFDGGDVSSKQTQIPIRALVSFAIRWSREHDQAQAEAESN